MTSPRPLTARERSVLAAMVENAASMSGTGSTVTPADRQRWAAQVDTTRAGAACGCGTCPTIDLTDARGTTPSGDQTRVVLEAGADGAVLLLFVDDDRLSSLELAPLGDEVFRTFPAPGEIIFGQDVSAT